MAEFGSVPACGFERGFHVPFRTTEEEGGLTARGRICPSCGQSNGLGWQTREMARARVRPESAFGRQG